MADLTPSAVPSAAPYLRRLLELLAEDAPAEEFEAVAVAARASGAAAPDIAEVDRSTGTALRVRSTLRQHRRRETELAALFDTASDLAALRDLDAVLRSIVRRARMLLGTDVAYLTLPDEQAGDTYMRVTDGSISPVFQSLRLRPGDGLGGLVAQSARPYASADYRTDERFRRRGSIDAGVLEEGLVAILGVPLLLGSSRQNGGQVIGVLFASDRSARTFSPEEVALLCSLAAHAAIAIDTARALSDTRAALVELAGANAVIQEHAAAMQRAEEAHDRLTDLVLRGGDVPEVAAAVARLLGGTITLHDPLGLPLAVARPDGAVAPRTEADPVGAAALAQAVEDSRAAGRAVLREDAWICAVLAGQELLGSFVLRGRAQLEDPDRRLFERAGVVTALLLLLRRTVAETENRVRGELIADLLTAPDRDPAGLAERGRRLGVRLDRPHLLLVAEAGPAHRDRLAGAATQYLFTGEGIGAEHAGAVVLLLPHGGTAPGAAARAAAAELTHRLGTPVTVAAAGPAAGPLPLAAAHAEAVRCLRALQVLGRVGEGADALELGFLGVLLGDGHDVGGFVTATLRPLLEYDARRGTALVRTLDAYFACSGSLIRAKEQLHVHVNTVVQRLDRIQSLLGPDWNSPQRALELQLALRLHALSGA
ncbi:helix-turn-helix domain-containing protein [Streptacidiphilus albus]|uniref:helix-turn-helix domain-containing protein n=1 Tax=Streptacidiphilus albus TaxID=105425 RepID=UPI00054C6A58|nr:helix-turn-helix domain-containing protein [Streptacidiphilus albus]